MSRPIGFSTGAIFPDRPSDSLEVIHGLGAEAVELSALRMHELELVAEALERPVLERFRWVSIHAPSRFERDEEEELVETLRTLSRGRYRVIVHPDSVHDATRWRGLGPCLVLENMDRRKRIGRYSQDFVKLFKDLPEAGLCLDLAHARQIDPSLVEAFRFLKLFGKRLVELHISEVSSTGSHGTMSMHSDSHLREFIQFLPSATPAIIESVIPNDRWDVELAAVRQLFSPASVPYGR